MEFHHIGIACRNIEAEKCMLHAMLEIQESTDCVFDERQNARLCMLKLKDGTKIELVEGDAVNSFLKRRQFLYHTCFTTPAIEAEINNLTELGATLVSEPKEAVLFQQRRVAFLMSEMGMIELLEES